MIGVGRGGTEVWNQFWSQCNKTVKPFNRLLTFSLQCRLTSVQKETERKKTQYTYLYLFFHLLKLFTLCLHSFQIPFQSTVSQRRLVSHTNYKHDKSNVQTTFDPYSATGWRLQKSRPVRITELVLLQYHWIYMQDLWVIAKRFKLLDS